MTLRVSIPRLILVPALLTFAVTGLRLVGEIAGWSPRFFSRDARGAAALVGIVWLPEMGVLATWFWIGLVPQLTLWITFTAIIGAIAGGLAAAFALRGRETAAA